MAERCRLDWDIYSGIEDRVNELALRDKVTALQEAMREMPQAEGLVTEHYFADGMYCRVLRRPAGTLIVGKVHKREHFYIVCKGAVEVPTEDGIKIYRAGDVIVSKPGTKRAVLALEDSVCLTVHRTKKRNIERIEKELIEPDNRALFDARNKQLGKLLCPG